jgi:hypothetical protein
LNTLEDTCLSSRSPSIAYAGILTLITNKNLKNAILRDIQIKAFFLATLLLLFLKNGTALIFANFFQHCTAAEFVEITRTRADHLPWQPTIAAELLLDGCKI